MFWEPYVACGPLVCKLCFSPSFSDSYYGNAKCVEKLK